MTNKEAKDWLKQYYNSAHGLSMKTRSALEIAITVLEDKEGEKNGR